MNQRNPGIQGRYISFPTSMEYKMIWLWTRGKKEIPASRDPEDIPDAGLQVGKGSFMIDNDLLSNTIIW